METGTHGPRIQRESGDRSAYIDSPEYGKIVLDFLVKGDLHDCPYIPLREAREEAFRVAEFPPELYHDFMDHGFRRSGHYFYRPACPRCRECRPLRVVVSGYNPTKSHRRVINKNNDIEVRVGAPRISEEKKRLYARYLLAQHNVRKSDVVEELRRFLYASPVHTLEFEYRLCDRIIAVGIVDVCARSLSTVYAYYDPEFRARSLGTFSALCEIAFCRDNDIPYYYVGYYVAECRSMNYKARFKPHEVLDPSFQWNRKALRSRE